MPPLGGAAPKRTCLTPAAVLAAAAGGESLGSASSDVLRHAFMSQEITEEEVAPSEDQLEAGAEDLASGTWSQAVRQAFRHRRWT